MRLRQSKHFNLISIEPHKIIRTTIACVAFVDWRSRNQPTDCNHTEQYDKALHFVTKGVIVIRGNLKKSVYEAIKQAFVLKSDCIDLQICFLIRCNSEYSSRISKGCLVARRTAHTPTGAKDTLDLTNNGCPNRLYMPPATIGSIKSMSTDHYI